MLKQGLFITGTDTGVGKTFIASLLAMFWKEEKAFRYFKPVQTGYESDDDTHTVKSRCALTTDQYLEPIYRFRLPASPDRAAKAEGAQISVEKIVASFLEHREKFLLIEGAGGLEVPLNDEARMSDLMRALRLPVLVVASTRLGTINHTLLTVEKIKSLGLNYVGVVLSGESDPGLKEILEREGVTVLGEIFLEEESSLDWTRFAEEQNNLKNKIQDKLHEYIEPSLGDQSSVWHPFTQHKTEKNFPKIVGGYNATLFTDKGESLLDAISSWWVNLHGHGHRQIAEAIAQQASRLEHVIFAGFTHNPAEEFSVQLLQQIRRCNPQWSRVFFSDNGSTAVEVALKMAYQFHAMGGKERKRFLALRHSYHGDTLGAMSVSEREGYHKYFLPLMAPVDFIEADNFTELSQMKERMGDYAACIVEPLVQGAGGMRMYSPQYLKQLADQCREAGVLFIADEIFTGFYRAGTFLASEQAAIRPDIVCLSKGITGGFLPLSVTVVTENIFAAFLDDSKAQAFLHGHSYTANPIACAAALASLKILLDKKTQKNIQRIAKETDQHLDRLKQLGAPIENIRRLGTIGAFDLNTNEDYFNMSISQKIAQKSFEQGVLLRPLGKTLYTVPPYCTTNQELTQIYQTIEEIIGEIL